MEVLNELGGIIQQRHHIEPSGENVQVHSVTATCLRHVTTNPKV